MLANRANRVHKGDVRSAYGSNLAPNRHLIEKDLKSAQNDQERGARNCRVVCALTPVDEGQVRGLSCSHRANRVHKGDVRSAHGSNAQNDPERHSRYGRAVAPYLGEHVVEVELVGDGGQEQRQCHLRPALVSLNEATVVFRIIGATVIVRHRKSAERESGYDEDREKNVLSEELELADDVDCDLEEWKVEHASAKDITAVVSLMFFVHS